MNLQPLTINPIGTLHCSRKYRYEQPRQGTLNENYDGYIELIGGHNFEQALEDLDGFDRLWLVYQFHLNDNWKPKVTPPRSPGRKIGVFATRSPHRPNPIGMSCVELVKIEKRRIYIKNFDLLDGTPIFDIKPYLPYSDSFPNASTGWIPTDQITPYQIKFSVEAKRKAMWLLNHTGLDFLDFAGMQLSHNPFDNSRKRVKTLPNGLFSLGYRTWKLIFHEISPMILEIIDVQSNYQSIELVPGSDDRYNDKDYHRDFLQIFPEM